MKRLKYFLTMALLVLISGCAQVDAFLFDAYPDGTPIVRDAEPAAKEAKSEPATAEDAEAAREAEALRAEIQRQKEELAALKRQQETEAAAAREQLWVRISFRSGQTVLTSQSKKALHDVAKKYLAQPRTQSIAVRGYCDDEPIGGYSGKRKSIHRFDSQQMLSQARADAVAAELVKAGIPASEVDARGYGATAFIATNDTVEGRNKNRRVDIFLIQK